MKTSELFINALGAYLPPLVPAEAREEGGMTGAAVAGDTPAVEMALKSARQALARWDKSTDELALLLYADVNHTGPDGWLPHAYLQRHAVGGDVFATSIRQGCNGLFGAIELAAGYLRGASGQKAAMITTADNVESSLLDRWTSLDGYFMGDGAAALILSPEPGFARLRSISSTTVAELEELHRGNEPLHPSNVISGRPTSFKERAETFISGGGMNMDRAIHLVQTAVEVMSRAAKEADTSIAEVAKVIPNNGPWRDLSIYLDAAGVPRERTTWEYGLAIGHSISDQMFALDHLLREGEIVPGDHVLLFGVGPGLNLAAAVIEIVSRPNWLERPERES